ncbi:hypothetical protein ACFSZS_16095 [Seohaeicola zhoushanensis]
MSQPDEGSRATRGVILLIERIAGIMLGVVTVLIVISAIGRYIFASPVPDTFDVSRLALGVAIAWGWRASAITAPTSRSTCWPMRCRAACAPR